MNKPLPDNGHPVKIGDVSFVYQGIYHPIEWYNEEPYRPRVETLVVKNGRYVFLRWYDEPNPDYEYSYRLPGGSVDNDSDRITQAENETNEEALIALKNMGYSNIQYFEIWNQKQSEEFKKGLLCFAYKGAVSDVFVGEYDGKFDKSKIAHHDLDDDMANNGKFKPIISIYKELRPEHIQALLDSPLVDEDIKRAIRLNKTDLKVEYKSVIDNKEIKPTIESTSLEIYKQQLLGSTVYHGSVNKYDMLEPTGFDLGNALESPGWSLYTWKDEYKAIGWGVYQALKLFRSKYHMNFGIKCIESHIAEIDEKSKNDLMLMLSTKPEVKFYVYKIRVNDSMNIGLGHSSNTKGCVTIRSYHTIPYDYDSYNLTPDMVNKYCRFEDFDKLKLSNYEELRHQGLNSRDLVSFLMDKDMMLQGYSETSTLKTIRRAIIDGELQPGDCIEDYLDSHNLQIEKISFLKRVRSFITENFNGTNNKESKPITESQLNEMLDIPEDIYQLNLELNSVPYGVLVNGRVFTDMTQIDFKEYRTISINDFKRYKVGVCWDFVNYEAYWFKNHHYKYKTFYIQIDNNADCPSHTFLLFYMNNKVYYFESSWFNYQGIKEFDSEYEALNYVITNHNNSFNPGNKYKLYAFEYDTKGLDKGLTPKQFMSKVTKSKPLDIKPTTINNPSPDYSELTPGFKPKERYDLSSFKKIKGTDKATIKKYFKDDEHVGSRLDKIHPDSYFYVDGNKKVGYIQVSKQKYICPIHIYPEYRGHGLSQQMLDVAVNEFGANKLVVYSDNEIAKKLYNDYGFEVARNHDNWALMKLPKNKLIKESISVVTEGLFSKDVYYAEVYKSGKPLSILRNPYCTSTPEQTIRYTISHSCNGRLISDKSANINERPLEPIILPSTYNDIPDIRIILYTVDGSKFEIIDKYGSLPINRQAVRVKSYEIKSLKEFIELYHIPVELVHNKIDQSDLRTRVMKCNEIFASEYLKLSKTFNFRNCIELKKITNSNIDSMIDTNDDYITLAHLDLWKYNPQARTTDSEELWEQVKLLETNTNSKISKFNCYLEYEGDWDDGSFSLYVK